MRLDKYLADLGIGTRKEIKKLIQAGLVSVDDEIITKPDHKVTESSYVCLEGEPLVYQQYQYFLLNKPAGYICTKDGSPNVLELVPNYYKDLNPVGRLDKETEGLLIITNDGQLTHQLISPKYHVDEKYYFECDVPLPAEAKLILSHVLMGFIVSGSICTTFLARLETLFSFIVSSVLMLIFWELSQVNCFSFSSMATTSGTSSATTLLSCARKTTST